MSELRGTESLTSLGDTFRENTSAYDGPEVSPSILASTYDRNYPGYFDQLDSRQLLSIAEKWSKDAAATIPLCVAAYERTSDDAPLVRSRAAELVCRAAFQLHGQSNESFVWGVRALGPICVGGTSFESIPGPEQEAVAAYYDELRTALSPMINRQP